jgi:hypothetical protein
VRRLLEAVEGRAFEERRDMARVPDALPTVVPAARLVGQTGTMAQLSGSRLTTSNTGQGPVERGR